MFCIFWYLLKVRFLQQQSIVESSSIITELFNGLLILVFSTQGDAQ